MKPIALLMLMIILMLAACEEVADPETDDTSPDDTSGVVQQSPLPSEQRVNRPDDLETARVVDVIDGDTVILEGDRRVRLIGINAPERDQAFYDEAVAYLQAQVEGQTVGLEPGGEDADNFGRELYYIWAGDQLMNWEMVRAGLANYLTLQPLGQYDVYIAQAESNARQDGAGIWQPSSSGLEIITVVGDPPGRDDENINGEYVQIANRSSAAVDMTGYMLYDNHRNTYEFTDLTLQPNQRVTLYSGCGRDTSDQRYWCQDTPVWNNSGDAAVLIDAQGLFVDHYTIEGR